MSAELSLMMNVNGGNIMWVQAAFGDFIGFVSAGCYLASSLSSQALMVILFTDYLQGANIVLSEFMTWVTRICFVIACTLANVWGVQWLSKLSWVFLVIIFLPFILQMFMTYYYRVPIHFKELVYIPPADQVQWGVLVSTSVWALGGFDAVGAVAGEVKDKKTFLIGVIGAFPLNLTNYLLPIFAGFIIDDHMDHWTTGYFTSIAKNYFPGKWLGIFMIVASAISNFCQLASQMASLSWTMWAMGKGRKDAISLHRYLPYFVSWGWKSKSGTLRPIMAIVLNSVLSVVVSILPFGYVVQVYLIVRVVNLLAEYGALVKLKFQQPDRPRPFEVPGGKIGTILLTLPTIIIAVGSIVAGGDWAPVWTGGATVGGIALLYLVKKLWVIVTHKIYDILSKTTGI
jgi:amino acid transporter